METFVDPRDNNSYKIVKINNLYWFAENLKYTGVDHYFPGRNSDNIEKYGCLYTWENAMKARPVGWRLPTKDDFKELLSITRTSDDSSCVRDTSWENSPNTSGFSVLPAGNRWYNDVLYHFGSHAYFWSATPDGNDFAYSFYVDSDNANVDSRNCNNALSVRCVKEI